MEIEFSWCLTMNIIPRPIGPYPFSCPLGGWTCPKLTDYYYLQEHVYDHLSDVLWDWRKKRFTVQPPYRKWVGPKVSHPGSRYCCLRCGKDFSNFEDLRSHVPTAHVIDAVDFPITYAVCLGTRCGVIRQDDIVQHLMAHSNDYMCPECFSRFDTSDRLALHRQVYHPGNCILQPKFWPFTRHSASCPIGTCPALLSSHSQAAVHFAYSHYDFCIVCGHVDKTASRSYIRTHERDRHHFDRSIMTPTQPGDCTACAEAIEKYSGQVTRVRYLDWEIGHEGLVYEMTRQPRARAAPNPNPVPAPPVPRVGDEELIIVE